MKAVAASAITMTNMIERVARQICMADGVDPDAEGYGLGVQMPEGELYPLWRARIKQARAAIEVMRDVDSGSPAILAAGKKSLSSCSEDPELEDARWCWQAMVDTALKE